jgi:hypothetical protein
LLALWISTSTAQVRDTMFINIFTGILSTSCSMPACHDGSFEPNFSSIASSYNTLVYHPIIKNNKNARFKYRVIPFDALNSVLYERITNCCFVNINDRMPFTLGDTLSKRDINKIASWINQGAKSPDGIIYEKPESFPLISKNCLVLGDDSINLLNVNFRTDKFYYEPFLIPRYISTLTFKFIISFASENINTDSLSAIFELSENDFQSPSLKSIQLFKKGKYWLCTINKKDLQKKTVFYYRVKAMYGINQIMYFPNSNTEKYQRQNWSFNIPE